MESGHLLGKRPLATLGLFSEKFQKAKNFPKIITIIIKKAKF